VTFCVLREVMGVVKAVTRQAVDSSVFACVAHRAGIEPGVDLVLFASVSGDAPVTDQVLCISANAC
jgi:hypothetical protein